MPLPRMSDISVVPIASALLEGMVSWFSGGGMKPEDSAVAGAGTSIFGGGGASLTTAVVSLALTGEAASSSSVFSGESEMRPAQRVEPS